MYCWEEGLTLQQWINVQSTTVSIVKTDHIRSHVSTRGLEGRSFEKGVMTDASLCMIGWGEGLYCVILQEEGFLLMSELNRMLLLRFHMNTHIAWIQKESLFMTTLIGLDGAQEV